MQHQRWRNGPFLLCFYWSVVIFKTEQGIFLSDSRKIIFPKKIRIVTLTKKKASFASINKFQSAFRLTCTTAINAPIGNSTTMTKMCQIISGQDYLENTLPSWKYQ